MPTAKQQAITLAKQMIEHYLTTISEYITANPQIGLVFALLIAFAESLPLLGTIIPGSVTMTAIGILVGQNSLPLGLTLLLAVIGALLGDVIGYWLGKHYQESIHRVWPFKRYPKMLKMGRDFFNKHGGKSIIIGRFIGPTRSSVPLIAGLLNMSWANFLLAVIPSAMLWAILYLSPGVLIGAVSLALPKGTATTFTLVGLGIIVLLWLIFWAIQRGFFYLANVINHITDRCWDWLSTHHGARLIPRLLTSKRDPHDHHQLTLLIFATLLLVFFCFIFLSVAFKFGMYHANLPVFHLLQTLRGEQLNHFFVVITELGNHHTIVASSSLLLLYFAIRRQWYAAWHVLIITVLGVSSTWFLKNIFFYSPRPSELMLIDSSSSFPSGHTTLSTSIIGFFAFLCAQCINKKYRWIPYVIWFSLVLLVAASRIALGAHWFCDVLAGICLGSSLLLLTIISYRRWLPILKQPKLLIALIIAIIIAPWAYAAVTHFHHNLYRYAPYFPTRMIALNDWWNNSMAYTPVYRPNRLGAPIQPFNLQWVGDLDMIRSTLEKHQWEEVDDEQDLIKRALGRFTSKNPEQHIAFLSQLYHDQAPVLFMIKHLKHQPYIIELRLWQTEIGFQQDNVRLFIGSINYHQPAKSYLSLQPSQQITLLKDGGTKELINILNNHFTWKTVTLQQKVLPEKIKRLHWNKHILLIKPL